jgi:phosphoenolpyruvate phosphomutase
MKAIIIAGGQGLRLRPLSEFIPKCFLPVGDKKILDWILEAFRDGGIDKIALVTGYKGELIREYYSQSQIKFYDDTHYQKSSILRGLFCAQEEMGEGVVASYSDIVYRPTIIRKLIQDKGDFSLVVERDWRKRYKNRLLHPKTEAEKVIVKQGKILRIGKNLDLKEANGEFIGLAKFSKKGAQIAVKLYNQLVESFAGKPFQSAQEFEKAYLTDFFQELVDRGYHLSPVFIEDGWVEIDTPEDLDKVKNYNDDFS